MRGSGMVNDTHIVLLYSLSAPAEHRIRFSIKIMVFLCSALGTSAVLLAVGVFIHNGQVNSADNTIVVHFLTSNRYLFRRA